MYLTFDEGYENGYTEQILDVLKEKNVKAIFFVTSHYIVYSPDTVKRMVDEGHIVANHTNHHYSMPSVTYSTDVFNKELTEQINWRVPIYTLHVPYTHISTYSIYTHTHAYNTYAYINVMLNHHMLRIKLMLDLH